MAIGDVSEKIFFQSAISATPGDNYYENAGTSFSTTIASITFVQQAAGSVAREVYAFLLGIAADDLVLHDFVDNTIQRYGVIYRVNYVLKGTERIYFSQDAGTDVNVIVSGYEEQVS